MQNLASLCGDATVVSYYDTKPLLFVKGNLRERWEKARELAFLAGCPEHPGSPRSIADEDPIYAWGAGGRRG
jgi:hypothetical protein